jgi:hypothetical protein
MDWASKEIIGVISYLLPGFLAAWVFHGLTPHPKKSPFERIVQALIFTAVIQGVVVGANLTYDHYYELGKIDWGGWGDRTSQVVPMIVAVGLGLLFAFFANHDYLHGVLRFLRITKRTSYPSEWFSAFNKDKRNVILHLKGKRRLYGWPTEWPDHPKSGHFVINNATWLLDDGDCAPLVFVARMLISASDVEMVEIMKEPKEVTATTQEILDIEKKLTDLQPKDDDDGKQSTGATPTEPNTTVPSTGAAARIERQCADQSKPAGSLATPTAKEIVNRNGTRKGRRRNA